MTEKRRRTVNTPAHCATISRGYNRPTKRRNRGRTVVYTFEYSVWECPYDG